MRGLPVSIRRDVRTARDEKSIQALELRSDQVEVLGGRQRHRQGATGQHGIDIPQIQAEPAVNSAGRPLKRVDTARDANSWH